MYVPVSRIESLQYHRQRRAWKLVLTSTPDHEPNVLWLRGDDARAVLDQLQDAQRLRQLALELGTELLAALRSNVQPPADAPVPRSRQRRRPGPAQEPAAVPTIPPYAETAMSAAPPTSAYSQLTAVSCC